MNGLGQHVWDFEPFKDVDKLVRSRKYILAIECIFCVASGLIKISILLFYRRLSSRVVSKAFRWTTWITIGYIVAYTIALTLAPILGCKPISAFWDRVDTLKRLQGYEFECFDEGADLLAASIISASQDLLTAILPTFLYWNLQISARQKAALYGIFAIGYGVVALGGLRAYYSWRAFYQTYDITWSTHDIFITSVVELHVGAFCANAPTLKVFFKHFFHDKLQSFSHSWSTGSGNRKDSAHSQSKSASPSKTVLEKVASLLGGLRDTRGYISNEHASVSVDEHGGVRSEIDAIRFPSSAIKPKNKHESANTINMLNAHYYTDIELGHHKPGNTSEPASARSTKTFDGADISALPPMPMSPKSARSIKSPTFSVATQARVVETPIQQHWPQGSTLDCDAKVAGNARTPTPLPVRAPSQRRPAWQSWS
jgi:hypothetical protein